MLSHHFGDIIDAFQSERVYRVYSIIMTQFTTVRWATILVNSVLCGPRLGYE